MSSVTNIMISGIFGETQIPVIENQLKKFTRNALPFMRVDSSQVGGEKCLECDIFIGAFNHMNFDLFIEVVQGLKEIVDIEQYDRIQVFIMKEYDELWTVVTLPFLTNNLFKE